MPESHLKRKRAALQKNHPCEDMNQAAAWIVKEVSEDK
jgi:hypothetical protein